MSEYENFVNKRNYYVPNYKYFPSSNYTYCSADDARCTACKASWTGELYMSVDATYCTGEDGCVCISLCEVSDWDDAVLSMNSCGYSISGMSSTTTRVLVAAAVGISVALLFFGVAYAVKRYVRSIESNRFDGESLSLPNMPCAACYTSTDVVDVLDATIAEGRAIPRSGADRRPPRNGPLLGLDGWKSMREKLIETERAEIQGGNTTLGGQRGNEGATEAPVIIIEHGEGYRPMSPSVMTVERFPTADNTVSAVPVSTADATSSSASTPAPVRPTAQSI